MFGQLDDDDCLHIDTSVGPTFCSIPCHNVLWPCLEGMEPLRGHWRHYHSYDRYVVALQTEKPLPKLDRWNHFLDLNDPCRWLHNHRYHFRKKERRPTNWSLQKLAAPILEAQLSVTRSTLESASGGERTQYFRKEGKSTPCQI